MTEPAASGTKRLATSVLIVTVAALVAILLFEILLRGIGFSAPLWYKPDPGLGWMLRPGVAAWYTREGRGYVEINAAGWRDIDHALEKPADTYRIAVLGDSYSEAMQVSREDTFWAQLPKMLADCGFQKGKRIEAMNFGVSGYGTAQEYLVLESKAMRYRPDLVLMQFTNGNDVMDNSAALKRETERPYYVPDPDGTLRLDDSFAALPDFRKRTTPVREALRAFADDSRVLQLVRNTRFDPIIRKASATAVGVEQGLEPEVLAPPQNQGWETAWGITERLIAKTRDHARQHGADFMLVSVPYAIQVHPDPYVRAELQKKLGVPDLLYPDQRIAAFALRDGIRALLLAPEMQRLAEQNKAYYHGFQNGSLGRGHWNSDGHRTAAALIAARLCGEAS